MAEDFKLMVHELQLEEPENMKCFDCQQPHPSWASLDFGTYICLTCSGVHRSLGVHISFVRSINLDNWSAPQYNRMKLGGNRRFKAYLDDSFFIIPIQDRYYTEIASEYKEKLSCLFKGVSFDKDKVVVPKKPAPRLNQAKSQNSLNNSNQNVSDSMNGFISSVSTQVFSSVSSTIDTIQQSPYTQQSMKKIYDWFGTEDTASNATSNKKP